MATKYDNPITDYAFEHYFTADGLCSLCGQSGIIHTEGIRSPAGVITGRTNFCICPNGQALRASGLTPLALDGATPAEAGASCPHCGNQIKLVAAKPPRQ